jgi:hypothetical protein
MTKLNMNILADFEAAQGNRRTGGQKRAHASGRARELGRFSENLPKAGDVKNDTAGL